LAKEGFTPFEMGDRNKTFNILVFSLLVVGWRSQGVVTISNFFTSEKLSKTELDQVTPAWLDEQGELSSTLNGF